MVQTDNLTVKDMIQKGFSEDAMIDMLKDQIKDAKAEIAAENKDKTKAKTTDPNRAAAREAAIVALGNYLVSLGLLPDDFMTDEEKNKLCAELAEAEEEFIKYREFMELLHDAFGGSEKPRVKQHKEEPDADSIIAGFLKSLE